MLRELSHPDVHLPAIQWSEDQQLHTVAVYSNPFRWRVRRECFNDCIRHLRSMPNFVVYVVELAYGDRPFEVSEPGDIQLRTNHELWHKEQLINLGVARFTPGWKYGAYVDGDFSFTRHDVALESIHQLQHYDFVQMFSSYVDMIGGTYGTANQPQRVTPGFAYNYIRSGYKLPEGFANGGWKKKGAITPGYDYGGLVTGGQRGVGATGGAWAWRRSAFDVVGGMMDRCILGHGDWFMTFGLVGEEAPDMHISSYHPDYRNYIYAWQQNAAKLKKNIGYVDAMAIHNFHGSKIRRAYSHRDLILAQNKFSPVTDIRPDWQGVYQLTPDKPGLRDAIRQYFIARNEDDPNVYGAEKSLV